MDAVDLHAEAWEGIRNGYESGRLAHAYVLVGSPRGSALHFAESFLKLLFCERADKPCNVCKGCKQVEAHKHVDTLWIEPQSKSRQITADDVRGLIQRMSQTSFDGGWKAGIILSADCMNVNSENALLKTLEEPPPKSILLLLTDSAESLLPTIISRCQKIVLADGAARHTGTEWHLPLMHILHELPPTGGLDAGRLACRLKAILDKVKVGIADGVMEELDQTDEALDESKLKVILEARTNARLKEVQADVFRVMLDWHRDVLMLASGVDADQLIFPDDRGTLEEQAKLHTQGSALKAIQEIEAMARRLDRNIPDLQIFDEAFRKLVRR
ncbi:ATP-binding protein [Pontiella sp.]|uniref:DNA polymerase III subunit n=1 Tax=Pontiella sp. TaxID=2837462 RepID=UPI003568447D